MVYKNEYQIQGKHRCLYCLVLVYQSKTKRNIPLSRSRRVRIEVSKWHLGSNKTQSNSVRESTEYRSYGILWESHLTEYHNVTEFRNLTLRNSIISQNSEEISVQQLEGDHHNPVTFVLGQHKKNSNVPDPTVFVSKTCFTTFKI